MFGCFLLLYCMIVSTQKHPRGIALKIVVVTEFVAKGFFYIAIAAGVLFFAAVLIENVLTKKRIKKEGQERIGRERHAELVYLKQEIKCLKRKLEESREETRIFVQAFHQEQAHRVEFENHLKNRTPQAAVNEALNHFL